MQTGKDTTQPDGPVGLVTDAIAQAPFAALLFRADADLTLLWRNHAHAVMSDAVDRPIENQPMFKAFPPSADAAGAAAKDAIRQCVARILKSHQAEDIGPYRFDLRGDDGLFVEHHWQMQMSPVLRDGAVVAILQVAKDVTHEVLSARLSETLKRAARSTAAVSYFSFDPGSGAFVRGGEVDAMFGFAAGEAGETADAFFARIHPEDEESVRTEVERVFAAPKGEVASFDYRVMLPEGGENFIRVRAEVATDPEDRKDKLVGTFVDLTDLERNRRSLADALRLQEALVSEANHRIKNSLAIATSMLRLEQVALQKRERIDPAEAAEALASTAARIRAISDAHGLMQMNQQRTSVSLRALVERLVGYARTTAHISDAEMTLALPSRDIILGSDTAITMAMILNEIMTNALKYGVQQGEGTKIAVTATLTDETLTVVLENLKATRKRSVDIPSTKLGSALIAQLIQQIGATMDIRETAKSYRTELTVPLSQIDSRDA